MKLLVFVLVWAILAGCNPVGDHLVRRDGDPKSGQVLETVGASLVAGQEHPIDQASLNIIRSYGSTIRSHSVRYGLDWRLVLAVMKCESSFDPGAESDRGAIGFMQIMPSTGEEVGKALKKDVLATPQGNIHGGIYYLSQLYDFFPSAEPTERLKLTLAAYNAGVGRIYDAQELAAYLHEDPNTWKAVQDALPLLSKRYYTLHKNIWTDGRPRVGWFGSARETVAYVKTVMEYYEEYRLFLN
jgi:membrane-bound lytic murein transglycosylase F